MTNKRALISVSDKTGAVAFAQGLEGLGYEILSTGGTATTLREAGIAVVDVADITGFAEFLDGRVKTLHPAVHGGILAMRDNPEHMEQVERLGIGLIDVVAINLYPFKETILKEGVELAEAVENIDIGGPTMIRAAAKNWQDVVVVIDPADYPSVLDRLTSGQVEREFRYALACKVFQHTAAYDALVAQYLQAQMAGADLFPPTFTQTFDRVSTMRYGENPHQQAAFYREIRGGASGIADAHQLHGKELSFNNIGDANGAVELLREFPPDRPCAVAVKHANPCGVAVGDTLLAAYTGAYYADPVSIFGGIVAVNRQVDGDTAREMSETFLEIILAPGFSPEALEILREKKNLRLLQLPGLEQPLPPGLLDMKKVAGGLLVQERDNQLCEAAQLHTVTKRTPSEEEMAQLMDAWRVVKHTKSNGICLFRRNSTVGIGPGQTNRITALELAIRYGGERVAGSVMASDAFFPFRDCVDAAAAAGITAIIQPGGSVRDEESILACDQAGIAMIFTGMRHFKH